MNVLVRRLDPDLPLPAYAHPGDAGADLLTTVDITLGPGERVLVPTEYEEWRNRRVTLRRIDEFVR